MISSQNLYLLNKSYVVAAVTRGEVKEVLWILRNTFKKYSEISKVHQGELFLAVAAVAGEGEV